MSGFSFGRLIDDKQSIHQKQNQFPIQKILQILALFEINSQFPPINFPRSSQWKWILKSDFLGRFVFSESVFHCGIQL